MGEYVKRFFGGQPAVLGEDSASSHPSVLVVPGADRNTRSSSWTARIAVYDSPAAAPRTEEVAASSEAELIEQIASRVFSHSRQEGGEVPYTVIREVTENFIHADFCEPVVSILDGGQTIRFADQGPGICDKDRAVLPGFTTATGRMKQVIRGVGSGLPIVSDFLGFSGGSLEIDDNLGYGTVVTVRAAGPAPAPSRDLVESRPVGSLPEEEAPAPPFAGFPPLTTRQKQVLSLVLELGEVGPTIVSKELSVALSTAYRDLAYLEHGGLIESDASGKRVLTDEGSSYLDSLFAQ
jgi:anti-sigma regulatory factor (Ser/Thr protein kinase)